MCVCVRLQASKHPKTKPETLNSASQNSGLLLQHCDGKGVVAAKDLIHAARASERKDAGLIRVPRC